MRSAGKSQDSCLRPKPDWINNEWTASEREKGRERDGDEPMSRGTAVSTFAESISKDDGTKMKETGEIIKRQQITFIRLCPAPPHIWTVPRPAIKRGLGRNGAGPQYPHTRALGAYHWWSRAYFRRAEAGWVWPDPMLSVRMEGRRTPETATMSEERGCFDICCAPLLSEALVSQVPM